MGSVTTLLTLEKSQDKYIILKIGLPLSLGIEKGNNLRLLLTAIST